MKKIILTLLLTLLLPLQSLAFTSATLFKDGSRIAVINEQQAKNLFSQGYKLETKLGIAAPSVAGIKWVQTQYFTLAGAGAILGATTIVLKSFKNINGTTLAMTDFGNQGFGTLEPGISGQEEQITFTGVTQNANGTATLTGVKTVLNKYPYTETSGLITTHTGGSKFVLSNTAGFYNTFANKENNETIDGVWKMPYVLGGLDATSTLVNKYYADNLALSGAPNASEIQKGIGQIATRSEASAGTSDGSTSARLLLPSSMATSTGGGATTSIPITGTNGKLSQNFLDLTQGFNFSGSNTYSGTSTFTGTSTFATTTFNAFPETPNSYPIASTSAANKGYVDQHYYTISSSNLKISADTERSTTSASMVLMKEIAVYYGGVIKVQYDMKGDTGIGSGIQSQTYVNGVAAGTSHFDDNGAYTTYTDTLAVFPGSLIQLYVAKATASTVYVQNFRIYYDLVGLATSTVNLN